MTHKRGYAAALLCLIGAGSGASPARSDAIEDFYKGKTVSIIVAFTTGNGADSYARLLGRFMGKNIPGHPTLIVKNMPGSLTVANYMFNVAPKDGATFAIFNRNVPLEALLDPQRVRFDPRKLTWIGSTNSEPSLCVAWHTQPVKTIDDLFNKELVVAATSINANTGLVPAVLNRVLDTKLKTVMGYPGASEMALAIERGEVGGRCGWSRSSLMAIKSGWVRDKQVNLLLQAGLKKSASMPNVPLAMDYVKTDHNRQLLKLAVAWDEMAWPFFAPPDTPADRVQALRAAFDKTLADSEFLAEAEKQGLDVSLVSGKEVETIVSDAYATPEEIVDEMRAIVLPPPR